MNNKRIKIVSFMVLFALLFGSIATVGASELQNTDEIETFLLIGRDFPDSIVQGFEDFSNIIVLLSVNWTADSIRLAFFSPQVIDNLLIAQEKTFSTAYEEGGNDYFTSLINDTYDIEVDHTISLHFDGVLAIVDALGGLEIEILDEDLNQELINAGITSVGLQSLSGEQCVAYASNTSVGLYNNQQTRFNAIASALKLKRDALNLKSILNILSAVSGNLKMDLNFIEQSRLVQKGLNFNLTESRQIFIFSNTTINEVQSYLNFEN